uniref:Uncharacterized protein n=1 Tax=Spongospora subterranea TaxID=70186 RepID=A0A0H5QNH1_9EUKA|eukprot:CRZ02931.1 hypothetical protein [Spongospora subterranea]
MDQDKSQQMLEISQDGIQLLSLNCKFSKECMIQMTTNIHTIAKPSIHFGWMEARNIYDSTDAEVPDLHPLSVFHGKLANIQKKKFHLSLLSPQNIICFQLTFCKIFYRENLEGNESAQSVLLQKGDDY